MCLYSNFRIIVVNKPIKQYEYPVWVGLGDKLPKQLTHQIQEELRIYLKHLTHGGLVTALGSNIAVELWDELYEQTY